VNEAQLVAETIATVKRDGWVRGYLAHPAGGHCILGAIGRARWGSQWDVDCSSNTTQEFRAYGRLQQDPLTKSLVNRILDVVITIDEGIGYSAESDGRRQALVYYWNDNQETGDKILDVLEKVQAEVGVE
jgi:hypothetical protein